MRRLANQTFLWIDFVKTSESRCHGDRQPRDIPRYVRNNLRVECANKYLKRIVKSRKNAIL